MNLFTWIVNTITNAIRLVADNFGWIAGMALIILIGAIIYRADRRA